MYARVAGGDLGAPNYFQQAPVVQLQGNPLPQVTGYTIDTLGGSWPTPTGWHAYPAFGGTATYYVCGQYHENNAWNWDSGVDYYVEPHTNGVLFRFTFDDNHDGRYDDFVVELVAMWT